MTLPLPVEYTWGFVAGRFIHAIADTTGDVDRYPEARAAIGSVTFTPLTTMRKVSATFVAHASATCGIDSSGYMIGAHGDQGVWLITGSYRVSFALDSGASIPAFDINVTTDHTEENPLQLATSAPYVPDPGVTVSTLVVSSDTQEGEVLIKTGSTITGVPQSTFSAPDVVYVGPDEPTDPSILVWYDTSALT